MKTKKYLLVIILLQIIFILCGNISSTNIETIGKCVIKYGNNNLISNIETLDNGFAYFNFDGKILKIFPNSEIDFLETNNYNLKKGSIIFQDDKDINQIINSQLYFSNQWGNCQFFRVQIPVNLKNISGNGKIIYFNSGDKTLSINIEIKYLFENEEFKYYGFFIPHFSGWETQKIIIESQIISDNKIVSVIKTEQELQSKEWEKQNVYFRRSKSKQVKKVSQTKYIYEKKMRDKIWDERNDKIFFNNGFGLPFETDERISSEFGFIRLWLMNKKVFSKDVHYGIDFARKKGTPIYAAADGIVRYSKLSEYYGNMVIIEHGLGLFTDYAHMNKRLVKIGQKVKKGDIIGMVGMTGAATGPHLHWGARIYGIPVDPRTFLELDTIFKP